MTTITKSTIQYCARYLKLLLASKNYVLLDTEWIQNVNWLDTEFNGRIHMVWYPLGLYEKKIQVINL